MIDILMPQLRNDAAFTHLLPFFAANLLPQIIKAQTARTHFFKFAGASVWLEAYGVHLMVSRVMFSRLGRKWESPISLLYAQIYDANWEEITNIELAVNTMGPAGERSWRNLKFPQFLPVPFYHNSLFLKQRWYGPEDPRMILVRNEMGQDEPLIVSNADHRNIKDFVERKGNIESGGRVVGGDLENED
ncbi:uncharacterized protein LODBEIA_P41300 [Lodderomyces beijingensis]|uniref:Uncharacterized protein n=1 Tax=Lodderomyces beijingensis TaxID=1775926 RepID=A0ABP0ZS36_9ASCO